MGKNLASMLLNRGNDLDGFFWPIYHYVKQQLVINHQLPLWNNLFLAGTPLLPDPQSPIFYPLNIIFLFFSIDSAFLISFFLHFFIGGVGMYICSKKAFGFSKVTSILLALLYVFTPKFAGYLEAGHVGLINSIAWIPFALWGSLRLRKNPKIKYSIIFGVSLALLYYSHLPTFIIISFAFGLLALRKKSTPYLVLSVIIVFGLTAVSILPQLEWQKYSTRYLLLKDKNTYPRWTSVLEPVKNIFIPWSGGIISLQQIDTEKWLAIGLVTIIIAFLGFLKLKTKVKFYFICAAFIIFLILLNNASPFYTILLKQNWYLLLRVATRFWILIILMILYLVGLCIEKNRAKIIYIITSLAIFESIILGWIYLNRPINKNENLAPKEVYEYLASDKSRFRVFCLTRCLSQKDTAIYNLELLDGYNTIQQKNFYQEAWQLTGVYWDYYTLSIPPFGTFTEKLNPDPKSLGEYNVKYVVSPYSLNNNNFNLIKRINQFYIYKNKLLKPRANAEITLYIPNLIRMDTNYANGKQIILSEVYSPGWKAYLNSTEQVIVQETPSALMAVDLKPDTRFVEFKYAPKSFQIGKYISLTTIFSLIGYGIYKKITKRKKI